MENVYTATEEDREEIREPRGNVVNGETLIQRLEAIEYSELVTVGDRVSIDVASAGIVPDLSVVDGRIQRQEIADEKIQAIPADIETQTVNPAGGITRQAWRAVREGMARSSRVKLTVDGEEDLLAMPAVHMSPKDTVLVYGQRDVGAVILRCDEDITRFVEEIVDMRQYGKVIVGGSWDRFHAGHRSILLETVARGRHVDIGVTSDRFMQEKDVDDYSGFQQRSKAVQRFVKRLGVQDRTRILRIDGFRGNAVQDGDALVVTEETRSRGEEINRERTRSGNDPLDLLTISRVQCTDGRPLSASRIRDGAVDRDGLRTDS